MSPDQKALVIAKAVATEWALPVELLIALDRRPDAVTARHVAMALCRHHLGLSYPRLAQLFHRKDHGTAMHACRTFTRCLATDHCFAARVKRLNNHLAARLHDDFQPSARPFQPAQNFIRFVATWHSSHDFLSDRPEAQSVSQTT